MKLMNEEFYFSYVVFFALLLIYSLLCLLFPATVTEILSLVPSLICPHLT
jgi:hypothetical protein